MNIACLIIGIDGWEQYTLPLVESIQRHEPSAVISLIDNASVQPYPLVSGVRLCHTDRMCYAAAINLAAQQAGVCDWYVVLSNDVLCNGPFAHILEQVGDGAIAGPLLMWNQGWAYLEGWCVACPRDVWEALGGWDENYQVSSWEDVDFSNTAMERGFRVVHRPDLPFVHLDQRQRFGLVSNYWDSERHNMAYFSQKRRAAQQEGGGG